MLLVALNPALGFDTVIWGQSDSALTVVVMLSAALALDGEFELAWALAALSVSGEAAGADVRAGARIVDADQAAVLAMVASGARGRGGVRGGSAAVSA